MIEAVTVCGDRVRASSRVQGGGCRVKGEGLPAGRALRGADLRGEGDLVRVQQLDEEAG